MRTAGRGQDDAGRELSRSAGPPPPLVPGRHRRQRPGDVRPLHADARRCSSWGRRRRRWRTSTPSRSRTSPASREPTFASSLRCCRGRPSSCSTASRRRARDRICAAPSRTRSKKCRTASPSSRSPAAKRRRSSRASAPVGGSRGSSPRRSPARPRKPKRCSPATSSTSEAVARITRQSNGWVAALVLLREHMSRAGATLDESIGEGKDAIFQYFAGEIFNRARPENQRVLMLTAISPSFTPDEAVALDGDRRRRAASRLPLSPASLHRPPPRPADDLSLPRAVSRIPARRGEEAPVERRAA